MPTYDFHLKQYKNKKLHTCCFEGTLTRQYRDLHFYSIIAVMSPCANFTCDFWRAVTSDTRAPSHQKHTHI